jgi:hypothetical protein
MNKKRILGIIIVMGTIFITFSIYSTSADGVTTQPGSVDDPMVTKSYVDEQVKLQVAAQIENINKNIPASGGSSGSGAALTVVKLAAGQILMAGTGSEFIVRTGFVTAVSTDGNGIPDVTSGKDIAAKAPIALNHLLIFPTDKRGVMPNPKKSDPIFVMVRGGYKLFNEDGSEAAAKETPAATPIPNPVATPAATPIPVPNPTIAPVVSP